MSGSCLDPAWTRVTLVAILYFSFGFWLCACAYCMFPCALFLLCCHPSVYSSFPCALRHAWFCCYVSQSLPFIWSASCLVSSASCLIFTFRSLMNVHKIKKLVFLRVKQEASVPGLYLEFSERVLASPPCICRARQFCVFPVS